MVDPLETPRSVADLYLARGDEVQVFRPILTGDVFSGIEIPGVERIAGDEELLAMVVSHPCTMRAGHVLKPGLQMVRVVRHELFELKAWSNGHYDKMPLPELSEWVDADDYLGEDGAAEVALRRQETFHVALLEERGRVATEALDLRRRRACLSAEGIALLQQRMSVGDNRFVPPVEELAKVCDAVLVEAELLEQWSEALVSPSCYEDPERLSQELARVAADFDQELSRKRPAEKGSFTLREDLAAVRRRPNARRTILRLLAELADQQRQVG